MAISSHAEISTRKSTLLKIRSFALQKNEKDRWTGSLGGKGAPAVNARHFISTSAVNRSVAAMFNWWKLREIQGRMVGGKVRGGYIQSRDPDATDKESEKYVRKGRQIT
jgi:hypothetical protein